MADPITIYADANTSINSNEPTTEAGGELATLPLITSGKTPVFCRNLISFDLSGYAPDAFSAVSLVLYGNENLQPTNFVDIRLFLVLRQGLNYDKMSWNNYSGGSPWASPGGSEPNVDLSPNNIERFEPSPNQNIISGVNLLKALDDALVEGDHRLDLMLRNTEGNTPSAFTDWFIGIGDEDQSKHPQLILTEGGSAGNFRNTYNRTGFRKNSFRRSLRDLHPSI